MAKIVFCEDEDLVRELFCIYMGLTDHEIYVASDGLEGFEIIARERPDLIITDLSMPNWDGFDLARAVREHPDLANTPIIFVTAYADSERYDKQEAEQYSPLEYMIKPFVAADVYDAISAALSSRAR